MPDAERLAESSPREPPLEGASARTSGAAFWLFLAILAWAPFPLGSNRPWSWNVLFLLVGICWITWATSVWRAPDEVLALVRRLAVPMALFAAALLWGLIQTTSWVPSGWIHPVWKIAAATLGHPLDGSISLDPWRTETAVIKLFCYGTFAWLSCAMARNPMRPAQMLNALTAIGAFYAAYAFGLGFLNFSQDQLFYSTPSAGGDLSGAFLNRNNFATYAGMVALCACVRFVESGHRLVVANRGLRLLAVSLTQFVFSRGVLALLGIILTLSAVTASGSRGGFLATTASLGVLLALAAVIAARGGSGIAWKAAAIATLALCIAGLIFLNGGLLGARFDAFFLTGQPDEIRLFLWNAAERMIGDAPWLGLGLGSFESAYPLYSQHTVPLLMDKALNDYLELAAGLGLPAALALWTALGLLTLRCLRGVFVRRRNRHYPMLAVGATALVAIHSALDMSLQIPAVALMYAAILGLGVGQAFPSRTS